MSSLEDFSDITRRDEPLAPYTWLKVGGPAQYFMEPRSGEQLAALVRCCLENEVPFHILGGGSNLLVRDEGVSGAVISLANGPFSLVTVEGHTLQAGAAALLSHAITRATAAGLAGLETLVGIPGTVGGAVRGNAGSRQGEIAPLVKSVEVLTRQGEVMRLQRDQLDFEYRRSNIGEPVILSAEFELTPDRPEEITRRMRKIWIMKKATQPMSFQSAGCIFKNPRGMSAGQMIDQAGLKGTRIGGCEVSERHANFFVTHEDVSSHDVLRLIDLVRTKVSETHGIALELEIQIWP